MKTWKWLDSILLNVLPPSPCYADSGPDTEVSHCLAILLYNKSILTIIGHIEPYAVILTDTPDLQGKY